MTHSITSAKTKPARSSGPGLGRLEQGHISVVIDGGKQRLRLIRGNVAADGDNVRPAALEIKRPARECRGLHGIHSLSGNLRRGIADQSHCRFALRGAVFANRHFRAFAEVHELRGMGTPRRRQRFRADDIPAGVPLTAIAKADWRAGGQLADVVFRAWEGRRARADRPRTSRSNALRKHRPGHCP